MAEKNLPRVEIDGHVGLRDVPDPPNQPANNWTHASHACVRTISLHLCE